MSRSLVAKFGTTINSTLSSVRNMNYISLYIKITVCIQLLENEHSKGWGVLVVIVNKVINMWEKN